MEYISNLMIPFIIFIIVVFALFKKVPVFDYFVEGVTEGLKSTLSITPSVMALVIAVGMLKTSGFFSILSDIAKPVTDILDIPCDIISLCLMRPISGSGSTALLNDILINYGPDSISGKMASVISGATETTFYAIAVYFGAIEIKNTRYTVPCALAADFTSMTISCILIKIFG